MKPLQVNFNFAKIITDWNHKEGAGLGSRCGYADYLDATFTIDSKADIQPQLVKHLESHGFPTNYFAIMDNNSISFNTIENADCDILSPSEQEYTHKIGESMYLCDYSVIIEVHEVYTVESEELANLFPGAEY